MAETEYDKRFVRILSDKDKDFFYKNYEVVNNLKARLLNEYDIPEDKILKTLQISYDYEGDNEFLNNIKDLIYQEIRDNKLSKILSENKVYKFSDFLLL